MISNYIIEQGKFQVTFTPHSIRKGGELMARNTKLKVIRYLSLNGPGGDYKPVEEYSEKELADAKEKMLQKASEAASRYFSAHPDEFAKLCPDCVAVVEKNTG